MAVFAAIVCEFVHNNTEYFEFYGENTNFRYMLNSVGIYPHHLGSDNILVDPKENLTNQFFSQMPWWLNINDLLSDKDYKLHHRPYITNFKGTEMIDLDD